MDEKQRHKNPKPTSLSLWINSDLWGKKVETTNPAKNAPKTISILSHTTIATSEKKSMSEKRTSWLNWLLLGITKSFKCGNHQNKVLKIWNATIIKIKKQWECLNL